MHQKGGIPECLDTAIASNRSTAVRVLEQYEKVVQKWKPSENPACTPFYKEKRDPYPTQKQRQAGYR